MGASDALVHASMNGDWMCRVMLHFYQGIEWEQAGYNRDRAVEAAPVALEA